MIQVFLLRTILFFGIILLSLPGFSQNFTISGRINDVASGEALLGSTVIVAGTGTGAVANSYGFYSLSLPKGNYDLIFRYLGFQDLEKKINLEKNLTLNVDLKETANEFGEVLITARAEEEKVENKKIGVMKMDIESIKRIPVVFGEVDILKTITYLPGIQSAGEGNSGLNIRGGAQDQNLILLDEAPVYNASHLMGFFSIFNGDAIKDLEVYKGGIPSKYGGRLSSLIDVRMKDGNNRKFGATGGIGTISSRLTLEGPIVKNKSSFMVSGRRSYADIFIPLAKDDGLKGTQLYFYDLNLKANYVINENNRVYLSGYFGRDVFNLRNLFGLDWGNTTGTLRWNHLFNKKLFSNLTFIYSDFDYAFNFDFSDAQNVKVSQGIKDLNIKGDLSYYLNPKSSINFGAILTHHTFNPGKIEPLRNTSIISPFQYPIRRALEEALYVEHDYKFSSRFNIRYGMRFSGFSNLGSAPEFVYAPNGDKKPIAVDTLTYAKNSFYNFYSGWEPRVSASLNLTSQDAIKASYNRTYQYIQQASNSASTLPVDQWIPANLNIKPQYADQVSVGYFKNFKNLETSVELYYKNMQNQIDYRDNAILFFNEQIDAELLAGRAWSYGAEFFVKKNGEKFTGMLSYTLAKTQRQIAGINQGKAYLSNYDRRHNLALVLSYNFTKRLYATGTFVYLSGNPVTFPVGKVTLEGLTIGVYDIRNNYRMPPYHRADIGVTLDSKIKEGKRWNGSWNFSIYNLYSRENPFAITFREVNDKDGNKSGQTEAVQTSLFKMIPSITYNFKF